MFKNPNLRNAVSFITLIALLNLILGCNYYKVATINQPLSKEQQQKVNEYINMKKDFILHVNDETFSMHNVQLNADNQTLNCRLDFVPVAHQVYMTDQKLDKAPKYKHGQDVWNEVHFYVRDFSNVRAGDSLTIPFSSITKADVIEKDNGRTTVSYFFGTLGVLAGVVILLSAIVAATKSSCPFVYTHDGQGYTFDGEIYGGAIYPQLERDDYLPLTSTSTSDTFKIRISNELKEEQYTNLAELIAVEHDSSVQLLPDKNGNVYTISDPVSPTKAVLDNKTNYTSELKSKDDGWCMFNDETTSQPFNNLTINFEKPSDASKGKLVLNLKNSLWLDYIYGEFMSLFGSSYNRWKEMQRSTPASELRQWTIDQGIPMEVFLRTSSGWKCIDTLPSFGPLAVRDVVVPIDLSHVKSGEVELRLHCGFMFWEINYAAMDFSANDDMTIHTLQPAQAIDETGRDVTASLQKTDGEYLRQLYPETVTTISYALPKFQEGKSVTYILHSRGWYNHVRDFKGVPDILYLQSFRRPGAFASFSKEKYLQWNMVSPTASNN